MSIETTKDGMTALRVEVRTGEDGATRAAIQIPGGQWMVLATVPAPAYMGSTDVQAAFTALVQAIVRQLVADALPEATVESVKVVAPGAPFDGPVH
jgi:hypothetical protein